MLKVHAKRQEGATDWVTMLDNGHHHAVLYVGKNANTAQDMADDITKVLTPTPAATASRGAGEAPDDKPTWKVHIGGVSGTVLIRDFGIGGANKACNFADELNFVIAG